MQNIKCPDCGNLNPDIRELGYTLPATCGHCLHMWRLQDVDPHGGCIVPPTPAAPAQQPGLLEWAVARWRDEVQHRPLMNKNRRSLDDAWRQVIRYAGGDPAELVGPPHDELESAPAQHEYSQRCIDARNALNAALHGDGAVIDTLEQAVASACAVIKRHAAPAPQPIPPECDVRKIMIDVVPGEDGQGHEVYAENTQQVVDLLTSMDERLEDLRAAPAQQPATSSSPDFIRRSNEDYVAWCATFYNPDALDERGMPSLHGLWAWQEQERRKRAGIKAPSVKS